MSENDLYRPETDKSEIKGDRLIPGAADDKNADPGKELELPSSVKKEVIKRGTEGGAVPYPNGTQISVHYETKDTKDGTVFDDSRNHLQPMKLIIGIKFCLQIWETVLKTMRKGELSRYEIPKELLFWYPTVAKQMRIVYHKDIDKRGGSGLLPEGIDHPDLDELAEKPRDLTFIFEIIDVKLPGEFEKPLWYMTHDERMQAIPKFRTEGNILFQSGKYSQAALKYRDALTVLKAVMQNKQTRLNEFHELSVQRVPLRLNLALALLKYKKYNLAIRHCTRVLKIDPENVKAVYRRGQANKGSGNWREARQDFQKAVTLAPTLRKAVKHQLTEIAGLEKEANEALRVGMQKMF